MESSVKVLFVCMGNICRSPTAQGVFHKLLQREGLDRIIEIDSAGTHAYHVGEPPDQRSRETAVRRGIDLGNLRARRVESEDFSYYDYVLAMDQDNLANLFVLCPPESEHKLTLFMDFAPHLGIQEVPDPYYGGASGFERVFDMVEAASEGLLDDIRRRFL
ncbi:MAG: low molecular weight protein-tyrosine-phosphatase [Pseudomonadota bacterium]|nr:low molecular weight protein-tyrosine-phosphatase [Pseudomonadota bacterium]